MSGPRPFKSAIDILNDISFMAAPVDVLLRVTAAIDQACMEAALASAPPLPIRSASSTLAEPAATESEPTTPIVSTAHELAKALSADEVLPIVIYCSMEILVFPIVSTHTTRFASDPR